MYLYDILHIRILSKSFNELFSGSISVTTTRTVRYSGLIIFDKLRLFQNRGIRSHHTLPSIGCCHSGYVFISILRTSFQQTSYWFIFSVLGVSMSLDKIGRKTAIFMYDEKGFILFPFTCHRFLFKDTVVTLNSLYLFIY